MDLDSYISYIEDLDKKVNLTRLPVVFHTRISTHGGISKENTHPFPLSNKIKDLQALDIKTRQGIAHNGIIPIKTEGTLSDTMTYIKDVAYPRKDWYKDPGDIGKSRMCVLDSKGIHYIGEWYTAEDGIRYSHYINTYEDDYIEDLLCELTEGYIMTKDRIEDIEFSIGEYFMDTHGNVYKYDYVWDVCFPIKARAVDHELRPLKFTLDTAYYMPIVYGR
jgi:hypothetical protein